MKMKKPGNRLGMSLPTADAEMAEGELAPVKKLAGRPSTAMMGMKMPAAPKAPKMAKSADDLRAIYKKKFGK